MITLEEQAILQAIEETTLEEALEARMSYITLITIRYEGIRAQLYFDKVNQNERRSKTK